MLPDSTMCAYCGEAEGHSKRCSVTKFGVAERRIPACACEQRCGDVPENEDRPDAMCKDLPRDG